MLQYKFIQAGEKLQLGDEYSTGCGIWRRIPDFMFNCVIPKDSYTLWRRPVGNGSARKNSYLKTFKEKLFSLFVK